MLILMTQNYMKVPYSSRDTYSYNKMAITSYEMCSHVQTVQNSDLQNTLRQTSSFISTRMIQNLCVDIQAQESGMLRLLLETHLSDKQTMNERQAESVNMASPPCIVVNRMCSI
jgi:hypothetical protein